MTREEMTEKQQMIVVCEGMLQLLEPSELCEMMQEISKKITERKTERVIPLEPKQEDLRRGPKGIIVRGVTYKNIRQACKAHGIESNYQMMVRRLREGHSPDDIFPIRPTEQKKTFPSDINGNVIVGSDVRLRAQH
jgi:signal recognition particle subunit SEC65